MALLEVKELHTYFDSRFGTIKAVNGISYELNLNHTLGIVGESGSGKSVSAMSIVKLLDENGYIAKGEIWFHEKDLVKCSEEEIREIRGNHIAVIFQEPMTSLNPVFTIEKQLSEPLMIHRGYGRKEAKEEAESLLKTVGITNEKIVAKQYPHQLSGGMRQRIMIAMALACHPDLLIADEPTTALDVTSQAQILGLMKQLQKQCNSAILFISHDLTVIHEMADEVAVMYCGEIVEMAPVEIFFGKVQYRHPYTQGLMRAIPCITMNREKRLEVIPGSVPHPLDLPPGCKFAPRCKYAQPKCERSEPPLVPCEGKHLIRCFYPDKGGDKSEDSECFASD